MAKQNVAKQNVVDKPCKECTAYGPRHYLNCSTLRCPSPMWTDDMSLRDKWNEYRDNLENR